MTRLNRLLLITFVLTGAEVLTDRGIYFYTANILGFSDGANLALALGKSAAALVAALVSHRLSQRLGHRRLLLWAMGAPIAADLIMLVCPLAPVLVVLTILRSALSLLKWPVIESYVSSGLTPRESSNVLGRFNITWALAPPVSLALSGPIMQVQPAGLFVVSLVLTLFLLRVAWPLEPTPRHLPEDHPEALPEGEANRYRRLMVSARFLMLTQSVMFIVIISMLPGIFRRAGVEVGLAPAMSSFIDLTRFAAFFAMQRSMGWHGRRSHMVWVTFCLPISLLMVLMGGSPEMWIAGQLLFGACAGAAYFAALYYAMIVKRASVEGSSFHEGLGSLGGIVGPGMALAGNYFGHGTEGQTLGTVIALMPFTLLLLAGAVWPLFAMGRRQPATAAVEAR